MKRTIVNRVEFENDAKRRKAEHDKVKLKTELKVSHNFYRAIAAGLCNNNGEYVGDLTKAQHLVPEFVAARDWYDSFQKNEHIDFQAQHDWIMRKSDEIDAKNDLNPQDRFQLDNINLTAVEIDDLEKVALVGVQRSRVIIQHFWKKKPQKFQNHLPKGIEYHGLGLVMKLYWLHEASNSEIKHDYESTTRNWVMIDIVSTTSWKTWEKFFFVLRMQNLKRISTNDVLHKDIVNIFRPKLLKQLLKVLIEEANTNGGFHNLIFDSDKPNLGTHWGKKSYKIGLDDKMLMKQTLKIVCDLYDKQ